MKTYTKVFAGLAGVAATALIAGAALSQGGPGGDRHGARGGPHGMHSGAVLRGLHAADADGDRSITRAELDQLQDELFAWLDRNGDGFLDIADRSPVEQRLAAKREEAGLEGPARGKARMARFDLDEDRRISRDEFLGRPAEIFERFDADGDAVISPDEIDARVDARRSFREWWRT